MKPRFLLLPALICLVHVLLAKPGSNPDALRQKYITTGQVNAFTSEKGQVGFTFYLNADTLPLTELGKGLWKNYEGGLYPGGTNIRPYNHDTAGMRFALEISPLNEFGERNEQDGKIVLLSIGMSNTTQEFSVFKNMADTFSRRNPKLVIVDGAQGGQTASVIKDPNANFWNVVSQRLAQQKVQALQVQAIWLKEANANPSQAFPKHAEDLKSDLKTLVKIMKGKFPKLKQVFLSSRIYGGYATSALNPEPFAYESGFSVKWLIDDQIQGDTSLAFSRSDSPAPWLSWGPYLWAKGTTPRADGLVWLPGDFGADGTHPSNSGRLKVAQQLLQFFSTDPAATPWFLSSGITSNRDEIEEQHHVFDFQMYPNPASASTTIDWTPVCDEAMFLTLSNCIGQPLRQIAGKSANIVLDLGHLQAGMYFIELKSKEFRATKKLWIAPAH